VEANDHQATSLPDQLWGLGEHNFKAFHLVIYGDPEGLKNLGQHFVLAISCRMGSKIRQITVVLTGVPAWHLPGGSIAPVVEFSVVGKNSFQSCVIQAICQISSRLSLSRVHSHIQRSIKAEGGSPSPIV
jgi:hypothetical protein